MSHADDARVHQLRVLAEQAREAAEKAGEEPAPYVPWPTGSAQGEATTIAETNQAVDKIAGIVLANKILTPREAAEYASPVRLAYGVTKARPEGQYSSAWRTVCVWGLGRRQHDGALTESIALKAEHPSGRSLLFLWTRPPVNVVLLLALGWITTQQAGLRGRACLPLVAAVLRAMPHDTNTKGVAVPVKWTSAMTMQWRRLGPGRITQPEPISAKDAREVLRIGGWA